MSIFAAIIVSLSLFTASTFAMLYPTRPVANTVYEAGKEATLAWIDDGASPHLDGLPKLQLDLYSLDNMLIKTFDKSLDPTAMKFGVWLSPTLGGNGSGCYFRFHSNNPTYDFYTARFTINGLQGASSNTTGAVAAAAVGVSNATKSQSTGSASEPVPMTLTFHLGSSLALPTGQNLIPTNLPSTLPSATLVSHTTITAEPWSKNAAKSGKFGDFDFETFKFRIVFFLWPAMMGISLAL